MHVLYTEILCKLFENVADQFGGLLVLAVPVLRYDTH